MLTLILLSFLAIHPSSPEWISTFLNGLHFRAKIAFLSGNRKKREKNMNKRRKMLDCKSTLKKGKKTRRGHLQNTQDSESASPRQTQQKHNSHFVLILYFHHQRRINYSEKKNMFCVHPILHYQRKITFSGIQLQ